ncbi:Zinc/iron permease [Neurospora intermedia]|uniref:Zinc/iron permease n=1 Tax=Neurospora intermedia TaxID=5142 RepID=A0ABR3DQT2_NEUIN
MDTLQYGARDLPWSSIPTDLLRAELSKRVDATDKSRPQCGSGEKGEYNTGLHVFALVLILLLSTLSCGFPLFSRRAMKGSKLQRKIIFFSQYFGTGVLMATAFVHLLPTAFLSLTDPCLPYVFSEGYKPLAGLVSMTAALVVVALESYLTTRGATHSHSHTIFEDEEENGHMHNHAHHDFKDTPEGIPLQDREVAQGLIGRQSPIASTSAHHSPSDQPQAFRDNDSANSLDLDLTFDELQPTPNTDHDQLLEPRNTSPYRTGLKPAVAPDSPNPEEQKRMLLQCLLLEAGILFHSVFIGMALSVATGPPFIVFLIAIGFHQTFEGLALGTRIAAIHFPRSSPRPWLMVLAFGTTTPIGQAIGLLIHTFYDPLSQTGLLMVGFMNAISSGLLLFAGLVQLLAEDFLSEKSYATLHGRKRLHAYLAVVAGAGLMSAVGAFA